MLLGVGPDGPVQGRRVVVTGMGVVACCGIGLDAFWDGLQRPAPDGERLRRMCAETVEDGRPRMVEHRYLRNGELRSAETRVEPLCAPDGERYGVRGTLQDITERVESQRRLRAAHDELRAITDSIGEGLCTVDVEGRLTYMNRAGEELLRVARDLRAGHCEAHPPEEPARLAVDVPQDEGGDRDRNRRQGARHQLVPNVRLDAPHAPRVSPRRPKRD